jgi:hypothetical protein
MNTDLNHVLRSISPVALQEHLRSRGWALEEDLSEQQGVVVYGRNGVVLDVPLRVDYADYSRRLEEVIGPLARIEGVSTLELVDDLTQPIGDVLALRVQSEMTSSGTIPLEDSIRIRQGAKTMLLAAAHSALSVQPWFPRMSRGEAVALLNSVHEGQTQRGSFTARFIVPTEPMVGQLPLDEDPFGRRVVLLLLKALESVRRVRALGAHEELLGMEKQGVSGNLLSALASMVPPGGTGTLEFAVSWSRNRRRPAGVESRVRFPREAFVGLDAAAEAMRGQGKTLGFEVIGYVTRLDRTTRDKNAPGEVVLAPTEGDARELLRVSAQLDAAAYGEAIKAHQTGATVRVIGTLQKAGRRWILSEASGFERLVEADGA